MSKTELRRQSRYTWMLVAFTAIMFVLMAQKSRAQTNAYFDPNGTTTGEGGSGTWSASNTNWTTNSVNATANSGGPTGGGLFAAANGAAGAVATNSGNYIFNFGGTAGTVNQSATYQAWGVNFLTTGYTWNIDGTGTNSRNITTTNGIGLGANSLTIANGPRGLNSFTFSGNTTATAVGITGTNGSTLTLRNLTADTASNSFGVYLSGGTISSNIAINVDIGTGAKIAFGSQSSAGMTNYAAMTLNTNASGVALNITNSSSGTVSMNGVISGSSGLVLDNAGTGKIALNASNTYAGGTTLNSTGSGAIITISNAAAFGTGTITSAGSGVVNYVRTEASGFDITNRWQIDSGSTLRLNANNSGWNVTASGVVAGAGSMMFSNSGVNYYLTGTNNSFGGGVNVGNGTLYYSSMGTAGQNSSLGTNGTITIGGPSATTTGGLRWIGTTDQTSDKTIVVAGTTGGLNLYANGATNGSLTVNGNINSTGAGAKTLTFAGYNTNTLALNGVINENGGANSVVIGGSSSGTVVLGNTNNSFTGAVTITNGTAGQYTWLQTANIGNSGAASALGKNGTINIGSASNTAFTLLKYTGTGETSDKVINLAGTVGGATLDQSGTGNLKFSSAMTATGTGAKTITLTGSTAGTGELGGAISDLGGNVISLTKSGSGTWTLSGANTYTGGTTVSAGTLSLSGSGTLGSTGGAINISAGTINLGGLARTNGALTLDTGVVSNGTLTASSYALTNAGTVSAILSGSGALTKSGAGTAILTAANNYTGGTTISAGSLQLGNGGTTGTISGDVTNNGTLAFNRSDSNSFGNLISGTGGVTISSGTVSLGNTNNTFSGTITVLTNAVLSGSIWATNVANTNASSSFGLHPAAAASGSSSWMRLDGGTIRYTGSFESNNMGITIGTGGGTIDSSGSGNLQMNYGSGALLLSGDQAAARTLTLTGTNVGALSSTGINKYNAKITNGSGGGVLTVVKTGTGYWSLTYGSGSTFTGGLEIRQGTLVANSGDMATAYGVGDVSIFDGAGLASSSATIRVGVTNNTYKLGGTNYLAYVELPKVLLTNNTIINNGTNVYTSGGINYTASTANFNSVLGSTNGVGETGGSYSLTKMGGGALTLNGSNTYSGGTIMNGGFLYVTNSGTMGSAGSAVAVNGGTLDLGNATRTNGAVTVGGGLVTNGTLSASSYALTNAGTISAALTGSGALTKTGSGTSVLSGANDYSGGTTVSAGTLQGDTTSLQGNISNNATVSFNQVGDGTYSGNMSGAGAVNVDAGGVVSFSGNNTYTGVTAITSATLKLGSVNALGAGGSDWTTTGTKLGINAILDLNGKNIANEALGMNASTAYVTNSSTTTAIWGGAISLTNGTNQFNVASGKDITLNGSIVYGSSSRQLIKNGDGVLTVAGSANTNQGIINVNAGTFRMGNATALGANTNNDVNVASGATLDVNGYTATTSSRTIKLGGAGVSGNGALQNSRASTSATVNNAVVLNADASVGGAGDMTLAGGISGSAGLTKVGAGTTTLTGAGSYTGTTTVSSGTLKLNRIDGGAVSAQTIAINGGTLLLGQANQISESSAVTLGGGTLSTGGFADRVGQLTVSADSAISGLVVASGKGVASSSSDFLFSSVDLTSYATSSGSSLNLGSSYTYGQSINIASSNYTGWTGYSTTSLNNFATKIQFGNTGMKAQINFNGGTGAAALTYVTAIPEPKVYVAMAMLVALVGVAEHKRRKRVVRAG